MPTMHRISCFRDDVIFVIYMYQSWIYKVDKTRGLYATEQKKPKPAQVTEHEEEKEEIIEEEKESKKNK